MRLTPSALLDPRAASSVRPPYVLMVNFLAAWTAAFTTTSINIALPSIQTEFHLGAVALGWLPLGYILASAVFLLPFGKMGDLYGRRLIYLVGLTVFALSSVGLVLANSYALLLILRIAQGVGGAMLFSTSTAMVTLAYPPSRRGFAMGVSVAAAYLGMTMGPIVGGIIIHNLGWRNLFLVTGCFAFFNLALDLLLLRRTEWREEGTSSFDWRGSVIYALSLCALLLGLSWLPLLRGALLTGAAVFGLAAFTWWEARVPAPVIDVGLFRHNRLFAFSSLTALINYASVWAFTFLMSLYLQFIKGLNPQTAGLVLVAGVALQCVISPFSGRLSDRFQPRWVASAGVALCVLGLLMLSFLQAATAYWYIVLALCLLGLGYGVFSGPNQSSIMGSVDRRHAGIASATVGTVRTIGMSISIAVSTLTLALIVGRHDILPADYPNLLTATRTAFAIFTVVCAFGVVASLVRGTLPTQPKSAESAEVTPEL